MSSAARNADSKRRGFTIIGNTYSKPVGTASLSIVQAYAESQRLFEILRPRRRGFSHFHSTYIVFAKRVTAPIYCDEFF